MFVKQGFDGFQRLRAADEGPRRNEAEADGMERAHREPAHGLFAEAVRQAFQHFGGGLTGEGDGGDPGG